MRELIQHSLASEPFRNLYCEDSANCQENFQQARVYSEVPCVVGKSSKWGAVVACLLVAALKGRPMLIEIGATKMLMGLHLYVVM
jgi:hypothetical protein